MLEIIGYLGCIYLVFKGVEIFQIAYMSTGAKRNDGIGIGLTIMILSIILAIYFAVWIHNQAGVGSALR